MGTVWLAASPHQSGVAAVSVEPPRLKVTPVRLAVEVPTAIPARAVQRRPSPPRPVPTARPVSQSRPATKVVEPVRTQAARTQPVQVADRYPTVTKGVGPARPAASSTRRQGSRATPARTIFSGDTPPLDTSTVPATPTPSATPEPASSPTPARPGEGEEAGAVVPARPIGKVDPAGPAWIALTSGSIEARFEVAADGATRVSLLQKSGSDEADAQVLEYLRGVKWAPKTVGGVPVADVQTMDFERYSN